jgi:hypothetical protein
VSKRLFRQRRANNSSSEREHKKVTIRTCLSSKRSEQEAVSAASSKQLFTRARTQCPSSKRSEQEAVSAASSKQLFTRVRTQGSPRLLQVPGRQRRRGPEAVSAASKSANPGIRRASENHPAFRASQRGERTHRCFGRGEESLGSVEQTKVTNTTTHKPALFE